ncbi:rrbs-1 [Symbiodinium microadriaticum]|nr:rrbs-1 [Symbiodinium microadriaticum]
MEPTDVGPVAVLPAEAFRIPREKPIPEPKGETVWEKFAREKGIKKRKRERMVFDEQTEEYKPRFGYKGINQGEEEHAIIEVGEGQDPYADPWAAARAGKKARVEKNEKHRERNAERLSVGKGRGKKGKHAAVTYDPSSVPGIPVNLESSTGSDPSSNRKRGKQGVRSALQLVQHSTASMGRYDEVRYGEPEKKIRGKKRSFRDNLSTLSTEKKTMKDQMRIVEDKIHKKKTGVTNSLAPYEGILPDAPSNAFKQKKGKLGVKATKGSEGKKKKGGKK